MTAYASESGLTRTRPITGNRVDHGQAAVGNACRFIKQQRRPVFECELEFALRQDACTIRLGERQAHLIGKGLFIEKSKRGVHGHHGAFPLHTFHREKNQGHVANSRVAR